MADPKTEKLDVAKAFALFVLPVAGHVVRRYGSDGCIGATRTDAGYVWDTKTIVAITHAEHAKFRREYARAIATGALKKVDQKDFEAQLVSTEKAEAAGAAKAAAEAKAAADAKKKGQE